MSSDSLSGLLGKPVQMRTGGGAGAFLRKVWAVAAKDIRAEVRAKEVASTMIVFGLLAVIIFGLAFDLRVPKSSMVVPGILWVIVLFAGVLGLHRSFGAEVDRDTLAGLLLAPVEPSAIYFGKLLSNLLYLFLMVALILPVLLVMFDTNLFHPLILLGLFLGIIGYAEVGTFFAALTANSRARESMLPVLLLPVMVPVFMAGVSLTAGILDGRPVSGLVSWLVILAVFDLIFFVAAYWIVDLIWDGI
ncbi:MAG: heme exporter protein CcmB [Caldilineaceae bacterium]|nr:heme exporter protein CcmB [Caldilineaceae bacterium]HRJ43246.1 heme exporter protein CcmB [Caldilineaceae bacterium]